MPETPRLGQGRPLEKLPTTVIDLQTSSFDAASGAVIAVTAIRVLPNGNGIADTFQWDAPNGAETEPLEVVNSRQIAAFEPVWPELSAYLAETLVVAHGAVWAETLLRKATLAIGVEWSRPAFLCTRRLARAFFPDLPSYGLEALIADLALAQTPPAAGTDRCLAVAELYRRCLGRMRDAGLSDVTDLDAFLDHRAGTIDRAAGRH